MKKIMAAKRDRLLAVQQGSPSIAVRGIPPNRLCICRFIAQNALLKHGFVVNYDKTEEERCATDTYIWTCQV